MLVVRQIRLVALLRGGDPQNTAPCLRDRVPDPHGDLCSARSERCHCLYREQGTALRGENPHDAIEREKSKQAGNLSWKRRALSDT